MNTTPTPEPVYQDDYVTLYHGDCQEIMPRLQADVLVTDPPYGQAFVSNMQGALDTKGIAGDKETLARDLVLEKWGTKPAVVFGTWKAQRPHRIQQILVWDKGQGPGMGNLQLPWGPSHEEIYILGNGWHKSPNIKRIGSVIRSQAPVTWKTHRAGREHPTQKPVDLMRHLVDRCPPGTIIDPFAGSATTLRAAKDARRRAIGIEVDDRWIKAAVRKLSQENLF